MASKLTLADISGYLTFVKAAAGGLVIKDFDALFAQVKSLLSSFGQLTDTVASQLDLAAKELKANPALLELGKGTLVGGIEAIMAKYPPSTLLSDIPEFGGGSSGPSTGSSTTTTIPSAVVFNFLNGAAPTAEKLSALADFAKSQFEAYKAAGVARAEIGPYEALGKGFAETIAFNAKYGQLNTVDFVKKAYAEIFERAATTAQSDHFKNQVSYFEQLYSKAGAAAAAAALSAKGAVLGQMLGFAVLDEAGQHPYIAAATKGLSGSSAMVGVAGAPAPEPAHDFI